MAGAGELSGERASADLSIAIGKSFPAIDTLARH
ncbi:hypothetical protein DSM3645_04395 [Blastopirellula marina DSM 3645]|uniref:Uncharacterized protein n=1 Tax=Blastopirellula marina DSM 3645 TaxID=314230 RepID=A4A1H9_9BACT|nr:hypothetical protein DSM3645_04395 [Blastopirellula marina DSM 3645]